MEIKIDKEFKALVPALSPEEFSQLEKNIQADGIRDPLVIWDNENVLLDGHNRYSLSVTLKKEYSTKLLYMDTRDEAKEWIINNALGKRNLNSFQRIELVEKKRAIIEARAKENQKLSKGQSVKGCLISDNLKVDTFRQLSKFSGVGRDTQSKGKKILEKANPETLEKLRAGESSIDAEFRKIQKKEKVDILKKEIKKIEKQNIVSTDKKFKTIVIDPPWEMKKISRDVRPNQEEFDYPTMSLEEIQAFDIKKFIENSCHIYLWTTQKYLPFSFEIFKGWGVKYFFTMVWHKPGGFQPIGLSQYNCEFVLFGKIGSDPFLDTKAFPTCFNASRKEHSRKPDEFYSLVSRVSPGPMIDIFSREKRKGFEQYGNETRKF